MGVSWTVPPADGIALNHLTLISNGENWNLFLTFNSKPTPPPPPQPGSNRASSFRKFRNCWLWSCEAATFDRIELATQGTSSPRLLVVGSQSRFLWQHLYSRIRAILLRLLYGNPNPWNVLRAVNVQLMVGLLISRRPLNADVFTLQHKQNPPRSPLLFLLN